MKLNEIFRNKCFELLKNSEKRVPKDRNESFIVNKNRTIVLLKNYNYILHTLVDEIFDHKPEIEENYTHDFIKNKINDFIVNLHYETQKEKSGLIDAFFKRLKNDLSVVYKYVVPEYVENLSINFDFELGNVKFIQFSWENYEKIFEDNGYIKNKQFNILDTQKKLTDFFEISCIAFCIVKAGEEKKAHVKANALIEEALSIIRFFNIYHNFGIIGSYNSPRRYEVNIYNKTKKSMHFSSGWKNLTGNCYFTKERFELLKEKAGLKNIDLILKKEKSSRTDLENKLIMAIRWFSEILKHREENEDNLFRLFTALESLLIQDKNEEKKKNLAERLAFINYSDKKQRLFVYKLVTQV